MNLKTTQIELAKAILNPESGVPNFVIPGGTLNAKQAVNVYHQGHTARMTELLGDTYKACWWVLGDDIFFTLCAQYIKENPSSFFDLTDYGERFALYLENAKARQNYAFIADLSRFEWEFKNVFHSKSNPEFDLIAFVSTHQDQDFKLKFTESVRFLNYPYSVFKIWKLAQDNRERKLNIDQFKNPEYLILYNTQNQVYCKTMSIKTWSLLKNLYQNHSFYQAIEKAGDEGHHLLPEDIQEAFQFLGAAKIILTAAKD